MRKSWKRFIRWFFKCDIVAGKYTDEYAVIQDIARIEDFNFNHEDVRKINNLTFSMYWN